jgi:hypothetical protein
MPLVCSLKRRSWFVVRRSTFRFVVRRSRSAFTFGVRRSTRARETLHSASIQEQMVSVSAPTSERVDFNAKPESG